MNGIEIKPDKKLALEKDAMLLGLHPSDVLDVILTDFFRGWQPADRSKFYRQFIPLPPPCKTH